MSAPCVIVRVSVTDCWCCHVRTCQTDRFRVVPGSCLHHASQMPGIGYSNTPFHEAAGCLAMATLCTRRCDGGEGQVLNFQNNPISVFSPLLLALPLSHGARHPLNRRSVPHSLSLPHLNIMYSPSCGSAC